MKNKIKELQTKFPEFDEAMLKISNTANFYVASQTDEHAVRLCVAYAFEAGYRQAVKELREESDYQGSWGSAEWADWLLEKAGLKDE